MVYSKSAANVFAAGFSYFAEMSLENSFLLCDKILRHQFTIEGIVIAHNHPFT